MLRFVAVCLHCMAVCCSVLQCVAACCSEYCIDQGEGLSLHVSHLRKHLHGENLIEEIVHDFEGRDIRSGRGY